MKGHSCKSMVWKKKKKRLCIVLTVSLLSAEICFLRGEAASYVQTENEDGSSETEPPEEETGDFRQEDSDSESTEKEIPEMEIPEAETSDTEVSEPETSEQTLSEPGDIDEENPEEIPCRAGASDKEPQSVTSLQIPERLEVILDPWEIDGRSQIYSEPFMVKNTGDFPGVLTLSFVCSVNEDEGVSVENTQEGLHDFGEKLIYMKAVFEDGEESVFTGEEAQCQAVLQPGEALSLWFEGEVNENAEEPWKDGDIEIEGVYSWEEEKTQPEEDGRESGLTEDSLEEE